MAQRWAWHRRSALVCAAALLGGCDDGTAPEVAAVFDPHVTYSRLLPVVDPLMYSENAFRGIAAAKTALLGWDDDSAGDGGTTLIPAPLIGTTLAYDTADARYVVDEARPGAPAGGVRVLYYLHQQWPYSPHLPLTELGYIDLTDESPSGSTRLGIRLMDTSGTAPVETVNYHLDRRASRGLGRGATVLSAVGSVTPASRPLGFDVSRRYTWDQPANTHGLWFEYDYLADGAEPIALVFRTSGRLMPVRWDEAIFTMLLPQGPDTVMIALTIDERGALAGEIRFNGRAAVLVSGFDGLPRFTGAESELEDGQRHVLRQVWELIGMLLSQTTGLFRATELVEPRE